MRVCVPVTFYVEVEFDVDGEDLAEIAGDAEYITRLQQHTAEGALKTVFDGTVVDEMVENITDTTGWCIQSLSIYQEPINENG